MGNTPLGIHFPAGSDPPAGNSQMQTLATDVDDMLRFRLLSAPKFAIAVKRVTTTIVNGSGGQLFVSFTGFSAPPIVSGLLEKATADNWNLMLAGRTTTTANFFVIASNTSIPAADGTSFTLHVMLVGDTTTGGPTLPVITT